jgi:hypothetical protein
VSSFTPFFLPELGLHRPSPLRGTAEVDLVVFADYRPLDWGGARRRGQREPDQTFSSTPETEAGDRPYRQESLPDWLEQVANLPVRRAYEKEERPKRGLKLYWKAIKDSSHLPREDVPAERRTLCLIGACPACGHEMDKMVRQRMDDEAGAPSSARELNRELDVLVYCNCTGLHPGRPADRTGCGSYGWLHVTRELESGGWRSAAHEPAIPEDLRWELRAEQLYGARLGDVRATAEKWTASVTSITGVFSIVALIKGPDAIGALKAAYFYTAIPLIALAVLLALIAIYLGALAAGGTPRVGRLSGREARFWLGFQASAAQHELKYSRRTAMLAVFAMLGAILVTWVGSR